MNLPPGTLILPLIVAVVASIVTVIEYVPFPSIPTLNESARTADMRVVSGVAPEPVNAAPLPAEPLESADDTPAEPAVLSAGMIAPEASNEAPGQAQTTSDSGGQAETARADDDEEEDDPAVGAASTGDGSTPLTPAE